MDPTADLAPGFYWCKLDNQRWHIGTRRTDGRWHFSYDFSSPYEGIHSPPFEAILDVWPKRIVPPEEE